MVTYAYHNLSRQKVTCPEVNEVLSNPSTIWIDLGASRNGNDRLMFVGLTKLGRVLEIGVELIGEHEHVFHAMDAGHYYLKELRCQIKSRHKLGRSALASASKRFAEKQANA